MKIINEEYILISLEFKETKKFNFDSYYISLMGDVEYYKIKKTNADIKGKKIKLRSDKIPQEINKEFISLVNQIHDKKLDENTKYCFPIDYAEIKRVVHKHTAG